MSHYVMYNESVKTDDFRKFWNSTTPCKRDGCTSVKITTVNTKNFTPTVKTRFLKNKTESVESYTVHAYDLGICGYRVHVKKNKIVNHKRMEVDEVHEYKSKPTKIIKGGVLKAVHYYVFDFDARCYDPLEHGDYDWR